MIIVKVRDVKIPQKGTQQSAGFDFFIPEDFAEASSGTFSRREGGAIELIPGESILIPSGIKMAIQEGYCLVFFNKSGIATKSGLQVGACVVDSDYRGEVHLHVTNVTRKVTVLVPGQKLTQGLILPVPKWEITEVEESEWDLAFGVSSTERGEGGFGSTGLI